MPASHPPHDPGHGRSASRRASALRFLRRSRLGWLLVAAASALLLPSPEPARTATCPPSGTPVPACSTQPDVPNFFDFVDESEPCDGTVVAPGSIHSKTWRLRYILDAPLTVSAWDLLHRSGGFPTSWVLDDQSGDGVLQKDEILEVHATVAVPSDHPGGLDTTCYRLKDGAHPDGVQEGFWVNLNVQSSGTPTPTPTPTPPPTPTPTPTPPPDTDIVCPADVSHPSGAQVIEASSFDKQWRLTNCGSTTWTSAYFAERTSAANVGPPTFALPPIVNPTESPVVTVPIQAGESPGTYTATYRLNGPNGPFGSIFSVQVEVIPAVELQVSPTSMSTSDDSQGWYVNNPVQVLARARCGQDNATCGGDFLMRAGILFDQPRFHVVGTDSTGGCQVSSEPRTTTSLLVNCPLALAPGGSRSVGATLRMQPSRDGDLDVLAQWQGISATEQVVVPAGRIHPVVLLHGILGSMPPQENVIESREEALRVLDPFFGYYTAMLDNLEKMGYEWNRSLFGLAYDWRKPNGESAEFLKDSLAGTILPRAAGAGHTDTDDLRADIVVHSMGGLVTRSYVQGPDWNHDVRKVVFIATPHRGFPFDYRTWEGMTWDDYMRNAPAGTGPILSPLMDRATWPTLVAKRYTPSLAELTLCAVVEGAEVVIPGSISEEVLIYTTDPSPRFSVCPLAFINEWAHDSDPSRSIGSLPEMLPTDEMPAYLLDPVTGAALQDEDDEYLKNLNADIGLLESRLGPQNIYVLAGNGAPQTDYRYRVDPPKTSSWRFGEVVDAPGRLEEQSAGDDLIPLQSATLSLSGLLTLPLGNEQVLNAAPFDGARHSPILFQEEVLKQWLPLFLTGQTVPFSTPYDPPALLFDNVIDGLIVIAGCPVNLMITDPGGRRVGFDPISGEVLEEIPNSVVTAPGVEPHMVFFFDPQPGAYAVDVTGYGAADFSFRVDRVGEEAAFFAAFGGTTAPDQVDTFFFDLEPNAEPVADAGPDRTVSAGPACTADVALDGSGSTDPDGDLLSFSWLGPEPGQVTEGARPILEFPLGTSEVQLRVSDGKGQVDTDSALITVVDDTGPSIVAPPIRVEQTSLDGTPVDVASLISVVDNCSADPSFTVEGPDVFPLGDTPVTVTARDDAGNTSTVELTVTVQDTTPPAILNVPPPVTVEQVSRDGTPVEVPLPTATDICDAAPVVTSDAPDVFPLGTTVVTFRAIDASGNVGKATTKVTVEDTTPPEIRSLSASPNRLWPPNHKMVPVRVSVRVEDICDAAPRCRIVSVKSDEPVTGGGTGNHSPDWKIRGDLVVELRAERAGKGDGRTYTLKVRCTDSSGNSTAKTTRVEVPHDKR